MDRRWSVASRTQSVRDFASDTAVATCLVVQTAFEHAEYDVVVAFLEPLDLGELAMIKACAIRRAGNDFMDRRVEAFIDINNELPEVR